MITRTTNDPFVILQFTNTLLKMALITPVMFTISLVMILKTSLSLSLVLAVVIPIIILGVILIAKTSEPLSEKLQKG